MAEESSPVQDNRELLEYNVYQAAKETAKVYMLNTEEFEVLRLAASYCQCYNEALLMKLVTHNPRLGMARVARLGNICADGSTILHVAASFGCLPALKLFKKFGKDVSFWVRDMQGRTPLHLAAANGHKETCEYLRKEMRKEKWDPIGDNAPCDLAGATPIGWAKISAKGRPKEEIENELFADGDRSVFSPSPQKSRSGKSPWRPLPSIFVNHSKENVIYAFSEAHGWTPNMEDRIAVSCPVPGRPTWSFFAVFDGHGGAFSSQFLADHFPTLLEKHAKQAEEDLGTAFLPGGTANDMDTTPELLTKMLTDICLEADALL